MGAKRYAVAIKAIDTADVFELAQHLVYAAKEASNEGVHPHNDLPTRLIASHIAFILNGDLPFMKYYQDAYAFCARMADREAQGLPITEKELQNAPVHSPS